MTLAAPEKRITLELRGGNRELWHARDVEILAEGPAGTGKTRTILELINALCMEYANLQVLITRKTQVSMTGSCLAEFNLHVLKPSDPVSFYGGSKNEPAAYRYFNGSRILVIGMDNRDKILSSWFDLIFENEATELTIDDHETLLGRLRGAAEGENPVTRDGREFRHRRIIADCNPSSSTHWLAKRSDAGVMRLIRSHLEDNPAYFYADGTPTLAGADYVVRLERMTGTRYQRFRLGLRVGVENAIYPHFDRELHVRPLEPGLIFQTGAIGADYGRRHNASVVPVRVDQYGRRWVFKAWAQPDRQHGRESEREIAQQRERYSISRLRVGPDMDIMIGLAGGEKSRIAEGSRQARTIEVAYLMGVFPGGLVPSSRDDAYNAPPASVTTRPDSPGLLFVEGGYGIEELCEEIENYHEVFVQSERAEQYVVARINDDRVSALEYACEELKDLSYFDFSIFAQGLGLATR